MSLRRWNNVLPKIISAAPSTFRMNKNPAKVPVSAWIKNEAFSMHVFLWLWSLGCTYAFLLAALCCTCHLSIDIPVIACINILKQGIGLRIWVSIRLNHTIPHDISWHRCFISIVVFCQRNWWLCIANLKKNAGTSVLSQLMRDLHLLYTIPTQGLQDEFPTDSWC